jgi:predicted nucleotidyltransferase
LSSVRIVSVDEQNLARELRRYVAALKRRPEVRKVYLCGSRARGDYGPYSDVDLLLILESDPQPGRGPLDRIPNYLPDRFPVGVDLFVYTEEEARNSAFVRRLLDSAVEM